MTNEKAEAKAAIRDRLRDRGQIMEPEPVDFFGEKLFIRPRSGRQRAKLARIQTAGKIPDDWFGMVIVQALCDESGELIYNDSHAAEVASFEGAELDALTQRILKLSKLSDEAIEEEEKN